MAHGKVEGEEAEESSLLRPVALQPVKQLVDAVDFCLTLLAHFLVALNWDIVQRQQLLCQSLYKTCCRPATCRSIVLLLLHELICLQTAHTRLR